MFRVEDAELIALGRGQEITVLEGRLAAKPPKGSPYRAAFVCVHCGVAETSNTASRAEHLRSVYVVQFLLKS